MACVWKKSNLRSHGQLYDDNIGNNKKNGLGTIQAINL